MKDIISREKFEVRLSEFLALYPFYCRFGHGEFWKYGYPSGIVNTLFGAELLLHSVTMLYKNQHFDRIPFQFLEIYPATIEEVKAAAIKEYEIYLQGQNA